MKIEGEQTLKMKVIRVLVRVERGKRGQSSEHARKTIYMWGMSQWNPSLLIIYTERNSHITYMYMFMTPLEFSLVLKVIQLSRLKNILIKMISFRNDIIINYVWVHIMLIPVTNEILIMQVLSTYYLLRTIKKSTMKGSILYCCSKNTFLICLH